MRAQIAKRAHFVSLMIVTQRAGERRSTSEAAPGETVMASVTQEGWEQFYDRVVVGGRKWPRGLWFAAVEDQRCTE